MTRPTTLVLAAFVLLLPGADGRADAPPAAAQPAIACVQDLQGTWEGVFVGQEAAGKVTLTFAGNSLRFQGPRAEQWYDATFTLQEAARPRRMRATLTGLEQVKDIGTVIAAIYKIEDGTLSLAGLEDDAEKKPRSPDEAFEGNPMFHYRLR
jgi:uncharacterized protein (TIGR03067 family)